MKKLVITKWELENFNPAFKLNGIDDPLEQELDFQRRKFVTDRLEVAGFDTSRPIEQWVDAIGSKYYFTQELTHEHTR